MPTVNSDRESTDSRGKSRISCRKFSIFQGQNGAPSEEPDRYSYFSSCVWATLPFYEEPYRREPRAAGVKYSSAGPFSCRRNGQCTKAHVWCRWHSACCLARGNIRTNVGKTP